MASDATRRRFIEAARSKGPLMLADFDPSVKEATCRVPVRGGCCPILGDWSSEAWPSFIGASLCARTQLTLWMFRSVDTSYTCSFTLRPLRLDGTSFSHQTSRSHFSGSANSAHPSPAVTCVWAVEGQLHRPRRHLKQGARAASAVSSLLELIPVEALLRQEAWSADCELRRMRRHGEYLETLRLTKQAEGKPAGRPMAGVRLEAALVGSRSHFSGAAFLGQGALGAW